MADPRIRRQTYTAASQPSRGAYPRGSVPPQAQRGVGSRGSGSGRANAGGNLGSGERQPAETAEQAAERELRERREQERAQEERERDARERKAQAAERLQREQQAVVSLERSVHSKARDVESLSAQSTQMDEQASAIRARAAVLHAHSLQVNGFGAYLGAGNRCLPPIAWSELPVGSFLERARLHPEGLVAVLQGSVERKTEEIRRECAGTDVEEEGTRLGFGVQGRLGVLQGAVERKAEEIRRECAGTDVGEEGSRLGLATPTKAPLNASGGGTGMLAGDCDNHSGSGCGTSKNLLRKAAKHASFSSADGGGAAAAPGGAGGSTGRGARAGANQQRQAPQSTQELVLARQGEERSKGWGESAAAPGPTVNAGAGAGLARQKEYRDLCLQTQVLQKKVEAVRLEVESRTAAAAGRLGDGDGRRDGAEERGKEGQEEGGAEGEEGEGSEEDVELGIAVAEAELRVLQAAEKRLSSEVAAAGATNRRVLQQWERIKGFNDERSNKWAEYELIRRINQAYAHMWWNLTNGQTQKALAGHVAKAGSALIGSVRAARDLATHEVTDGAALPPSWLCRPVSCSFPLRMAQFVDAMSAAADVAAGSAAELEPAVASMARQLSGLQQQAEQQHMEVLSEWLPQLAQLQGQARQLVSRTHDASDLVSHWWKQPALGIIPWVTVEGRSMEEWAVALEAVQMHREG
ncbi:unnamed protein product [Closterium sp. Yama58-4]|nr:unnamed protein product [Closterium sp. Yama58-4]